MLALAFRNLFSHPGRNALTAVSVTIAMMLVTFVVAAQLQSRRLLTMVKGRNNMIVAAKAGTMPLSFQKQIESIPGVKRVLYMYVSDTTSSDRRFSFMLHATTADYTTISDSWFYVPPEALTRWDTEHTGALVARQTALELKLEVGSRVTVETQLGPLEIVVSGISPRGYKSTGILVHYDYFTELFKKQNRVNVFWAELLPTSELSSVATTVDNASRNTSAPTQSFSAAASVQLRSQAGKVIPRLITGAGLIILLATLLVTGNTIAMSIRERVPQLAALRAIGFRRSRILRLLVAEVLMICLAGGLLGCLIPMLVFRQGVEMGLGKALIGKVELPLELLAWVLLLSAGLGVVASFFPAWRASRVAIADSLRIQA